MYLVAQTFYWKLSQGSGTVFVFCCFWCCWLFLRFLCFFVLFCFIHLLFENIRAAKFVCKSMQWTIKWFLCAIIESYISIFVPEILFKRWLRQQTTKKAEKTAPHEKNTTISYYMCFNTKTYRYLSVIEITINYLFTKLGGIKL